MEPHGKCACGIEVHRYQQQDGSLGEWEHTMRPKVAHEVEIVATLDEHDKWRKADG